jgi:hypothetical protein
VRCKLHALCCTTTIISAAAVLDCSVALFVGAGLFKEAPWQRVRATDGDVEISPQTRNLRWPVFGGHENGHKLQGMEEDPHIQDKNSQKEISETIEMYGLCVVWLR